MKGDELLARPLHSEAERHDRLFYRWTPEGGDHWNPLARGNRSELKDKLIATEDFSERHYQAMYERYLRAARIDDADLAEIAGHTVQTMIGHYARALADRSARFER